MYKETLKRKPLRGFGTFLSILIVVFTILLLMLAVGWVQILLHIGYLQYALLVAVLTYLLGMLAWQLTKYDYTIRDGSVLISRGFGERKKTVFEFPARNIEALGRPDALPRGKRKRLFLFAYMEKEAYWIVLPKEVVVLAPTETFIQKLKEEYEKTHC